MACRVASPNEETQTGSACEMSSPVSRCQASATSFQLGGVSRRCGGVPRSQTISRVVPPGSGPTITMPPARVSPIMRGARVMPLTSARNISMVAAVPGKSNPAALRTVERPPSQPTR
ncbi:hypothetical protein SMICM17S_12926 [Streptomyces microflavus]